MSRSEQIREMAIVLFARQGYRGTSMKDIASALNIRAPSLYNHLESKQDLLRDVTLGVMRSLMRDFDQAVEEADGTVDALRRVSIAHTLHHARHPDEVKIGNREIPSLEMPARAELLDMRRQYSEAWKQLVHEGVEEGVFEVASPKLAVFAILEMGIGVANWYRPDGPLSDVEIADYFAEIALRTVGAVDIPSDVPPLAQQ